jgi:Transposase, Mutator family
VHRASDPLLDAVRLVAGTQADRGGATAALRIRPGGNGRRAAGRFRRWTVGKKYPAIAQSWRRNWEQIIPFFAFPAAVHQILVADLA